MARMQASTPVLPPIGSVISLPNSSDIAILKYVGSVDNHDGVFCGLELCGALASSGKNDGIINGIEYFQVSVPKSGLFVPLRKILGWLSHTHTQPQPQPQPQSLPQSQPLLQPQLLPQPNSVSIESTSSGSVAATKEIEELKRHIISLEKQLLLRENDLKELDIQLDELDATLRSNDARLARKEERFNRYKVEKEEEISMLLTTIESLEKKIVELEERLSVQPQVPDNSELVKRIEQLEKELKLEKDNFSSFKAQKSNEINELRKFEMKNYTLELEIEKLREHQHNEDTDSLVNDLRKQIEERDERLKELEGLKTIKSSGELPIYKPQTEVDPSAGREDFCNYCDTSGHTTGDCPYEKDNLEIF